MASLDSSPGRSLPTTAWSMVWAAQDPNSPDCVAAINRCISAYWRPVFYYLRAKGIRHQQAEDLTQEFFLHFYERAWINRADPQRGRSRTYLLTILKRFLSDQLTDRAPRQKVFDSRLVAFSVLLCEADRDFQPPLNCTAEDVFMRQWARSTIVQVQRRVEAWCAERGRPDWYWMFCQTYFPDTPQKQITQQAIADRLHLSRDQVRYGLQEVNKQFVELLRDEVDDQTGRGR